MVSEDDKLPIRQPFTAESRERLLKALSTPRPRPKPGDPMYELDKIINACLMCERDKRDPDPPPCDHCKPPPKYPQMAPDGQIFVCGACGKTSKDMFNGGPGSGWDESCMMNSILCKEDSLEYSGGRITKADAVEGY